MFNLKQAVDSWCQSIAIGKHKQAGLEDEVKDHLYCEIEALQRDGLSEEQAFTVATRKLGEPQELLDEYSKNQRVFSLLCPATEPNLNDYTLHRSDVMNYKQNVKQILGQSIMWAAAIISSGLLLGDAEQYEMYMLLLVVLATTSIAIGPGLKEAAQVECRYIRRLLGMNKQA